MPVTTLATVNDIMNRVAAEVGIEPVSDPYGSAQQDFIQMRYLLQVSGEELGVAHPWETTTAKHQITTADGDTGNYNLPPDFYYMINQTGWDVTNANPLHGPLSPQEWSYLEGRDLSGSTIHASFRLKEGKFSIYPQPPPEGLDITFEYISTLWVRDGQQVDTYKSTIGNGNDIPLFDKTLISRHLKVKYLEAKGFDTTKAQDDFNQSFNFLTGFDKAATVLDAGNGRRGHNYLDMHTNVPDTKYGDWEP